MATTFTPFVSPYAKADRTHAVQIRMTHNRKSRYIATTICLLPSQFTRDKRRIKDAAALDNINATIKRYRDALARVEGAQYYDADKLLSVLQNAVTSPVSWSLDVFQYADAKMEGMTPKTAEGYRTAFHALERFVGCRRLDVNDITATFVARFREFLETEPALRNGTGHHRAKSRGSRAVSYYLTCVKAIHNMARDEFNDDDVGLVRIPRSPFKSGTIPAQPVTEHRTLSAAQVLDVASFDNGDPLVGFARDVFVLSFLLVGMNSADLFALRRCDMVGDVITYRRAKTSGRRSDHAAISVRVSARARVLIERYAAADGERLLSLRYCDARNFNRYVNRRLKAIAPGLTLYHARHSWATIARNDCGIPFDVVHDALNHARRGSERVTDIYVERDWSAVWDAQERVERFVFGV